MIIGFVTTADHPPAEAMTTQNPVLELKNRVEEFLLLWVQAMADAGYLADTTAKREDCIRSYWGFLDPVLKYLETDDALPTYAEMLQNRDNWAGNLIQFAQRHRARGITVDMFQGCFKTLIHSLEQIVFTMDFTPEKKLAAVNMIRRWADGAEILMLSDWKTMGQLEAVDRLAESNRELTLEKNKYENILEATSDMVLVTGPDGMITEANTQAKILLKNRDLMGRYFGEVLGLGDDPVDVLLDRYPVNEFHETKLQSESSVYNLRIIPLQTVSLASRGYMIVLSDISLLVSQRESLQQTVEERTSALAASERNLKLEKNRLEELNITLRTVLQSINEKNTEYQQEILQTIQEVVLPSLDRIGRENDEQIRDSYINMVKDQLIRLTGDTTVENDMHLLKLSPTELKICQFVQSGNATKDIAEALGLSVDTIQTHRKNIRKKLGIRGRNVSLYNYLNSPDRTYPIPSDAS